MSGQGLTPDGAAPDSRALRALIALARSRTRIVAFTGAGISTESGIPDYRGPQGVWTTGKLPRLEDYRENPETRERYWSYRRENYPELLAKEPNAGHRALVDLERAGRLLGIITQNIDGLHQKAGTSPERVVELHGSAHRIRCLNCDRQFNADLVQTRLNAGERDPRCPVCGGFLRAATVLFGESLPEAPLSQAVVWARSADLMLIVGSSLVVNPAAQLPVVARGAGAALAMVNRTPTPLDALADVRLVSDAGPTLAALASALLGASDP